MRWRSTRRANRRTASNPTSNMLPWRSPSRRKRARARHWSSATRASAWCARGMPAMGSLSPSAMAKTMGIEVANTVRLFELYFGPYPYKLLAVTNIPYSYGQGWPGLLYLSALSFLDSTQRHNLGIRDNIRLTDFFRAHESSHQWWGHRVGWKSYHDQWLSEGFAEFSGYLYILYRQNHKEYLNSLRLARQDLAARDLHNHVYESVGPGWMGRRLR